MIDYQVLTLLDNSLDTFKFCTAWPDAPFTKLSITEIIVIHSPLLFSIKPYST